MSTIVGTEFNDYLFGTAGDDEISGGDGNDIIFGNGGNDVIYDGAGVDTLFGGDGDDTFVLTDNNGFGPSLVFDPFGLPAIYAGAGYDTLDATTAVEAINFAEGTFATASLEAFIGSSFGDTLSAALVSFDVVLSGQAGDDTLTGGSGNDRISGGPGADWLTGGLGNDVFVYASLTDSLLSGFDVIQDLAIGSDVIEATVPVAATNLLQPDNDVLVSGFDVIQDLAIGSDVIEATVPVAATNLPQLGEVAALEAAAIAAVLTESAFGSLGAATFTGGQRTFLALNDETAGFQASTDAVIEITGYSGDLANLAVTA